MKNFDLLVARIRSSTSDLLKVPQNDLTLYYSRDATERNIIAKSFEQDMHNFFIAFRSIV